MKRCSVLLGVLCVWGLTVPPAIGDGSESGKNARSPRSGQANTSRAKRSTGPGRSGMGRRSSRKQPVLRRCGWERLTRQAARSASEPGSVVTDARTSRTA